MNTSRGWTTEELREAVEFGREGPYADADREQFHVLMLDGKNQLIGVNLVSQEIDKFLRSVQLQTTFLLCFCDSVGLELDTNQL